MKIVVIGATGTIGKAVVKLLSGRHEVVQASRSAGVQVDIDDPASVRAFYAKLGAKVDAIVCAAGNAVFKPLAGLSDDDFAASLRSKLMGQVNVVRYGIEHVSDHGSFTLTSGVLSLRPMQGSAAISPVNAAVEAFARAAALELPRGIRINTVSPGWVTDTLQALGMDPSQGQAPEVVAKAYVASITGEQTGQTISP